MPTQAKPRELSPYGNRVVSVAPGRVKTGIIDKEIEEIASAICLMSRPEESAINGSAAMEDDGYAFFKGVDGF